MPASWITALREVLEARSLLMTLWIPALLMLTNEGKTPSSCEWEVVCE